MCRGFVTCTSMRSRPSCQQSQYYVSLFSAIAMCVLASRTQLLMIQAAHFNDFSLLLCDEEIHFDSDFWSWFDSVRNGYVTNVT